MQKIQLYIEGQRVDMFSDESVSITDTIQNVKDIGKYLQHFQKRLAYQRVKQTIKYLSIIIILILLECLMQGLKKILISN